MSSSALALGPWRGGVEPPKECLSRAISPPEFFSPFSPYEKPVIVLTPRLWALAEELGYLKNESYTWVRQVSVPTSEGV